MVTEGLSENLIEDLELYRLYLKSKSDEYDEYLKELYLIIGDLFDRKKWHTNNRSVLRVYEKFLISIYNYKDLIKTVLHIELKKYKFDVESMMYYEDIAFRLRKGINIISSSYMRTFNKVSKLAKDIDRYSILLYRLNSDVDPLLIKELDSLRRNIPIKYIEYAEMKNKEKIELMKGVLK